MAEDGTFQKIGKTEQHMYGPRGLVLCGMNSDEQQAVYSLVQNGGVPSLPIISVTDEMVDRTMSEVLEFPDRHGFGGKTTSRRAVVMSGLTEMELHWLMSAYRRLELPRPLWATLTPTSEGWSVRQLVAELAAEDDSMGH